MICLYFMDIKTVFNTDIMLKIIRVLQQHGGDFAEIYVEKSHLQNITCAENKVESISAGMDLGIGLRLVKGEETFYGSSNFKDMEILFDLANQVSAAARERNGRAREWKLPEQKIPVQHNVRHDPQNVELRKKIALINTVNSRCWKTDSRIAQVEVSYGDKTKEILIYNSLGVQREEKRVYQVLMLQVVAKSGTVLQTGREVLGGLIGFEIFTEEAVDRLIHGATERALKMLAAKPAPSGKMAVVLDGQAGGTMIHEAIGHSLEADSVQKGISPVYHDKIGRKIAAPAISVVDDATLPNMRGSFVYDDEGTVAQRTVLVEKGILKSYLYDLFTAGKDGKLSTGNSRRESYHYKPVPRMSNTFILPGKDDPNKIIDATRKGLYVKKMGGGQVNTATGDFVFEVSEAYTIENGQVGTPVRGAILTGNGPEVLRAIDMVGNDLGFEIGTCGKDGQHVPVGDGQPTLRIPEIIVGGTE